MDHGSQARSATGMSFLTAQPVSSTACLIQPVMKFAEHVKPGMRVLDVGCGNGYWAGQFAALDCVVVGVDISPSGIAIARETYPAARFEVLSAGPDLLVQLREPPFDLIVSTEVVEHLYSPQKYAAGCFAALAPGGTIVLSTPYHGRLKDIALAVAGKMDFHHDALREGGHIKFFSRPVLTELLRDAGFTDISFAGAGRVRWLWKSMVLAARRPPT